MSSSSEKILPIRVNGEVIHSPQLLKKFVLPPDDKKHVYTLFTVYKKYQREHPQQSLIDFYEDWCSIQGTSPIFTIEPVSPKSRAWRDIVRERVSNESVESIVDSLLEIALSGGRNAINAAQTIADWYGVPKESTVKVDASVDADVKADVNVKPDLFKLPNDG